MAKEICGLILSGLWRSTKEKEDRRAKTCLLTREKYVALHVIGPLVEMWVWPRYFCWPC
jgi:hypothetical protein